MLTRHGMKVLDFGLAKMVSEAGRHRDQRRDGHARLHGAGTSGRPRAIRETDLFALGLVLYEMAVGSCHFRGHRWARCFRAARRAVPAPSQQRADLPPGLDALVAKLLEKDPQKRPRSASEVARELTAIADRLLGRRHATRLRPAIAIPAAVLLGCSWREERGCISVPTSGTGCANRPFLKSTGWVRTRLWRRFSCCKKRRRFCLAIRNWRDRKSLTRRVGDPIVTAGAKVEIQDYRTPNGAWIALALLRSRALEFPTVIFDGGFPNRETHQFFAPSTEDKMQFAFAPAGTPAGMVHVPKGTGAELIDFVGFVYFNLPAYDIDQFEVSNRQYQEFVDQGGYQKREYWKEEFVKDGKKISWDQAMDLFRDPTGRPGPSTWEGGHFPQGQAEYPVSGVSWYEAAAYAEFAGKSLPTVTQWYQAAPTDFAAYTIDQSNFSARGPWRVGSSGKIGPFGTYDMSGNVREWSFNTVESDRRFILGGAWRTQTYQASDPEALPPFDRSEQNGFRCVRNSEPLPSNATAPLVGYARDFSKTKPVADDVFRAYQSMYAYDRNPLNAQSEGIVENTADWTREKLSIDAGYGGERLPLFLFLPKNVHPPFQTVLFFPSARVNLMPSSQNLGDLQFVDYIIQSGRALLYPIYEGTYERVGHRVAPGAHGDLDLTIQESKEVRRSVDYLETRADIDKSKIAYLGVSQGSAYGVIFAALEPRFQTVIFLDGGFFLNDTLPPRDQVNFAPRIKKPVLMVNGRYDFTFSLERAQLPLFRMLGTPEADKRHVVFDTPHDISQNKAGLSKEVLAWLDKYLGRVN